MRVRLSSGMLTLLCKLWMFTEHCSAKVLIKKFESRKTFRFTVDYQLMVNYWRNSATHRIRGRYWAQPMSSHWTSIRTNAKMMLVFKSIIQLSKVFKAVAERLLQNLANLAVQSKMELIQRTSNVIISLKCHAKMKPESNFSSWNSAWSPVALAILIMLKYVEPKETKRNKFTFSTQFHEWFISDLWRKQYQCTESRTMVWQSNTAWIFITVIGFAHRFSYWFFI